MLTNFSKWMIYTASYIVLYPLLIIKILFNKKYPDKLTTLDKIHLNFQESKLIILILVGFILISTIVLLVLKKTKPNSRCTLPLKSNVTYEISGFLLPYIISILTIDLDWYGWIINAIIYVALGFIALAADIVYLCPAFLFLGYKLYKDQNDNYVYTKLSKEQYNQLCVDEMDGIEVKKLTSNLLLSTRKKF